MEHLVARWDIEHREGLRGEAAEAQVRLPARHARRARRARSPPASPPPSPALPARPSTPRPSLPQEYLMKLPTRFRKLSERAAARKSKAQPARVQFSWIFNREVKV